MVVIRTVRFTVDPDDTEVMLARRRDLVAAVRARGIGPAEAQLSRVDDTTWLDIWRWDSGEVLRAALDAAPTLPEAAAAFSVTRDQVAEVAELVDEL